MYIHRTFAASSIIIGVYFLILAGCGSMSLSGVWRPGDTDGKRILPGFRVVNTFHEQEMTFRYGPDVRIHINAPSVRDFHPARPVLLVFYALPNNNSIEHTAGKAPAPGDDFRFHIQNIAAQTRWLRGMDSSRNLVVAYLETSQRSWPAWGREHPDRLERISAISDTLASLFRAYQTSVVLSGHSGGGSFIFGFLDRASSIPHYVERIAFLDSDYNYTDEYGAKLADWLEASPKHFLSVLAYNDSIALYQGKPFVSPTGGTWYRTKTMQRYLASRFRFVAKTEGTFIRHRALDGRLSIILRENPDRAILHTLQVEKNGFIHTMLSGTSHEEREYTYFGDRVYDALNDEIMPGLKRPSVPQRPENAISGSAFMEKVSSLSFEEREREILAELSRGNLPDLLRKTVRIDTTLTDSGGVSHTVTFEVMPDYLAIGGNGDFCRIPMGPATAQALADRFRMSMPTRKLVDAIYAHATIKLEPVTYWPVGNANELVPKFVLHNAAIEEQLTAAGARRGDLVAGIKKDVVISNRILEPDRPGHVCIYGWHRLDAKAIQPLTNIHIGTYTDYSHGVRLLNSEILIDGVPMEMADVLKNPNLYSIISDEAGVMGQPRY
jgi:hypothetical protein